MPKELLLIVASQGVILGKINELIAGNLSNFTMYYTYYSYETNKGINGLGYIGCRKLKNAPTPHEEDYFGTPSSPKNLDFKNNKNKAKIILGIFDTKEEALAHEVYLHEIWDVKNNPHFANASNQTSKKFTGSTPWNKGISLPYQVWNKGKTLNKLSKEQREKISRSCKGINTYKRSEKTKAKMSKNRANKSPWNKGKKGPEPANKGKKIKNSIRGKKFKFINLKSKIIVEETVSQMAFIYGGSRTGYSRVARKKQTVCNGWKLYDNQQ